MASFPVRHKRLTHAMATMPRTLEEFLALPETKPASEYYCDEVVQKPMPDRPHNLVQQILITLLSLYARRTRSGEAGVEARYVFGPPGHRRAFVPDVSFLSNERLPAGQPRSARRYEAAPDLAVEILSPNQPARQFAAKLRFYLRHGVRLVWVVDPDAETVSVYAPSAEEVILRPGDTLDGGNVLPGFSVPVAEVFELLHPTSGE